MAFKGFKFCHLHSHAEMLDLPVGTESKVGSLSNTISKDEKSSGDRVEDIQNILQEYVIYVVCSEQISSEQQFLIATNSELHQLVENYWIWGERHKQGIADVSGLDPVYVNSTHFQQPTKQSSAEGLDGRCMGK